MTNRVCLICGKRFYERPARIKIGKGKYCSFKCKGIAFKGRRLSPATEFKKGENIGEKNHMWVGDKIKYMGLHTWLNRWRGKPKECEFCGRNENLHWANKNFEYKRKLEDWFGLCAKCHQNYDRENGWGIATRRFNL